MNTQVPLKCAVVGYGKMGKIRAECIQDHPFLKLVGVCDTDSTLLQGLTVPVFGDYEDLLALDLDIVFACTPNLFLPKIVCYFIERDVHVFCEKPPGRSKEDIDMMMQAHSQKPNTKLKFGFNHRYHQPLIDAKAIVDNGRLGRLMWMRAVYGKSGGASFDLSWRNKKEISGGGILIDQGIHMLDLFRMFGGEFTEMTACIGRFYWNIEVEDNVFALLRNESGVVASLHSSATQWQHKFLLDIYLEKGYLSISGILSSTRTYGQESLRIARCAYDSDGYPLPNPEESIAYYDEDNSWKKEIDEFIDSILKDLTVRVGSPAEAYKTMELVEKIYQSDKSWQSIK